MSSEDEKTVLSGGRDASEVPEVSLSEFVLTRLRAGLDTWGHKPFVVDVTAGTQVKFCDVESQSRRVASALSRRGFKKGHVLYYVTYEMAHLYVVQLAVWRLGGAVRGSYQREKTVEYLRQIRETDSRFVLVDAETAPKLQEAITSLEWPVVLLSVGNAMVPGATSFTQLLEDDGKAYPEYVAINPREDVVLIVNTSGSTGVPKSVLHTHYSTVALIENLKDAIPRSSSLMESIINYGIGTLCFWLHGVCNGLTIYHIGKLRREEYFDHLFMLKPQHLHLYPYEASWFSRCGAQLARVREAGFLNSIFIGGWVLDHTTSELLVRELPGCVIRQVYGMSEITFFTMTDTSGTPPTVENQGQWSVSSGKLLPFGKARIVDLESGVVLGRGEVGEIHVRSPCVMLGYLQPGSKPRREGFDEDSWFHTKDIGFFDEEGNLYVKERMTFLFRYEESFVSPCEIEAVLQEHTAVLAAGVVGVSNPVTNNLARAFVVLRPERHATAEELQKYVAQKLVPYKHLHGGVRFVEKLPENRGGKLDRMALKKLALQEQTE